MIALGVPAVFEVDSFPLGLEVDGFDEGVDCKAPMLMESELCEGMCMIRETCVMKIVGTFYAILKLKVAPRNGSWNTIVRVD